MRVGLDFGTTNSGVAHYDGQTLRVFRVDPRSRDAQTVKSLLYITRDQETFIGQAAIDLYFAQNLGRPIRLVRKPVGIIDNYFAEVGHVVKEVHALIDANMPGRLFQSLKTALPQHTYEGTSVFDKYHTVEQLVALVLRRIRRRAEDLCGRPVRQVMLGRPVRFDPEPERDKLAQDRLERAARLAGFQEVDFELEPVAAALHYELGLDYPENVLVFDFGGGTLDVTVMRLGEADGRQVKAASGVRIGGDLFDERIVRARMLRHLGYGSTYGRDKRLPVPVYIFEALAQWQAIPALFTLPTMRVIQQALATSDRPDQLRALYTLISKNYGFRMFQEVERAKCELSDRNEAVIRLMDEDMQIVEPVTVEQLEAIIAADVARTEECVEESVIASGLGPEQIDVVLATGGSSAIPIFQRMLERKFGAGKVRKHDLFAGVTQGLAVAAYHHDRTGEMGVGRPQRC
jgi:hypothetical chaperone protein